MQAGRKRVNPSEVNNRGFLRNVLQAMKIKFNGTVVNPGSDGYVNIPYCTNSNLGLCQVSSYYAMASINGILVGQPISEENYSTAPTNSFISKATIESNKYDIIKRTLTDNRTHTWTDAERLAALSRLGCSVDSETGAVTWTAQE